MYKKTKNDFMSNGVCKYEDEYGNSAFLKRTNTGFTARLRFKRKGIKTEAVNIFVPARDNVMNGVSLPISYTNESDSEEEDVVYGINAFAKLLQHWIDMIYEINFFSTNNNFILNSNPGLTSDDVNNYKLNEIAKYEEVLPIINTVLSK